ncbi:AMP-binding protein [Mycolicibacterium fluoranthenivorans]|uniref:Amino acid adenylation domain-containing protein n=1 Tax=Mycolicibacterium fluoranthenivorans TaxID=258505 RepID=A0A1G4VHX8_9MYCO|nr:AMP-binding protein [Mycolicibacterium fluoranthenivorans]SCX07041.1 amino acid adenylation domain-containing protein [Mycolicibacterium fluoranthenivorans]
MTHQDRSGTTSAAPDLEAGGDVLDDFVEVARARPNHAAVVHGATVITYQDLTERVHLVAARYRSAGFGGDRAAGPVGVVVAHTPAFVDHLLGVLQAGAAFTPIDANFPPARMQTLAAVLGLDRVYAAATVSGEPELRVESLGELPAPGAGEPCWTQARPSDPAYVLCTSGSTGQPKPVVVSRRAVTVTVRALRKLFALTPEDRVLQFAALGWDTCLEEVLPALTAGATVIFDDAAHSGSFPSFCRMLAERAITVLDLPTAFWHELVLYLHEEQVELPGSVRLVVIGGERVDSTRLRQWRDLDRGQVTLLNTYGCTETTMITHAVQLSGPGTEPDVAAEVEAPLGRPLPHVGEHVTEAGELLVSGPGLASGYLGSPGRDQNAFRVADHGFGPRRWFHTGDLVVRMPSGLSFPRGRTDDQIKVLGVRVHPAEVEARLNTHPAVRGAVVVGERRLGRTVLVAYVVSVGATTSVELKRYLRRHLPSQFVPSKVTFVAALSHTSSGKVDRAATQRAAANRASEGAIR